MIPTSAKFDHLLGGGFSPGSNIFFIGKAFTGANTFSLYLIAKALERGEGAIIVTVDKPYTSVLERLSSFTSKTEGVHFIDLYSIPTQFLDFDHRDGRATLLENRKDLETLLNVIMRRADVFERYRIMIPVSSLLLFVPALGMSAFVEKVSAMVRRDGMLGFYTLNSGMHDERTIEMFKRLSDGVLEFSEREGKHYFRVQGIPSAMTTNWVEFRIERGGVSIESFTISKIR